MDLLQYGVLRGSSTVHALISMIHLWFNVTGNSVNGNFVLVLLVDYGKAFDRVNSEILVNKLHS